MSEAAVDGVLVEVSAELGEMDAKRKTGALMKGFYARVGRGDVDAVVVKRRAEALVGSA